MVIFIFFSCQLPQTPCVKNPCLNGGQCIAMNNFYRLCLCAEGFSGVDCEIDLGKKSFSLPICVYKESIIKIVSVYVKSLHLYKDLCIKNPHLNGSQCIVRNNFY